MRAAGVLAGGSVRKVGTSTHASTHAGKIFIFMRYWQALIIYTGNRSCSLSRLHNSTRMITIINVLCLA